MVALWLLVSERSWWWAMNTLEFIELVIAMRDAQKDYFSNHSRQALARAKYLEVRVDRALLQIVNGLPQQGDLFDLYPTQMEVSDG